MRIVSRSTLKKFWTIHADAEGPLKAWNAEAKRATWATMADIKKRYANASVVDAGRVVFNIGGNKYRLICSIKFKPGIIFIRFVGTHAEYDKVDANSV